MTRILIADDHPLFRQGLKEVLQTELHVEFVGEAESGNKVLDMIRKDHWDAVVLDISMPGPNGLEVLKAMKRERPRLPALILSAHPEGQYAVRALKNGAAGYITKESGARELIHAINKILRGGKYVTEAVAEKLAVALQAPTDKPPHEALSDREFQILQLIGSGKSVKQIGAELALSPRTVSTYRGRILEKMKMRTNTQLIRYALQNRLID